MDHEIQLLFGEALQIFDGFFLCDAEHDGSLPGAFLACFEK
jgi:hypothetical protein